MRPDAVGMTEADASQLWAMLGAEGKAPPELNYASHVLPSYSVAIQPWLDRLTSRFLRQLCRRSAHFKLVLAPYGGGKTHFLLALGASAIDENFAVAYVPCGDSISRRNSNATSSATCGPYNGRQRGCAASLRSRACAISRHSVVILMRSLICVARSAELLGRDPTVAGSVDLPVSSTAVPQERAF